MSEQDSSDLAVAESGNVQGRDDGGPAFGTQTIQSSRIPNGYGPKDGVTETMTVTTGGMTLRDYAAIHASIGQGEDSDLTVSAATRLMSSSPPTGAENAQWWLDAEARLRYAKADAMLKARSA